MSIISEEDKSREGFKPHTRSRSDMSGLPDTTKRASAPSTKESDSGSVHFGRTRGKLSRIQRQQASTSSTGTSRSITIHSEDIPPMGEEEVGDMRWVEFLTLVDQNGGQYRPRSSTPAAYGGFSDIWQCDAVFSDDEDGVVAVKKLRAVKLPPGLDDSQTTKKLLGRLTKELRVWMRLQHPNVAPFRGNVSNYLEAHPEADRMKLAQGVATGLEYLHSSSPVVVHGDMKPSTSLREAGNARWIAPELLLEEGVSRSSWNARATSQLSLTPSPSQILTDDIPFKGIPDGQLVIARHKGASPIPDGAVYPSFNPGSELMEILHSCWNTNHQARPEVGEVVKLLNSTHAGSEPSALLRTSSNHAATRKNTAIPTLEATTPSTPKTSKISPYVLTPPVTPAKAKIEAKSLESTFAQKSRSKPVIKTRTPGQLSQPLTTPSKPLGRKVSPNIGSQTTTRSPRPTLEGSSGTPHEKTIAIPTSEAPTPSSSKTSKTSSSVLTPPITTAKAKIEAKSLESTLAQKNRSKPALKARAPGQLSRPLTTPSKPLGRKASPNIGAPTTTPSSRLIIRPTPQNSSSTPHEKNKAIPISEAPTPSSSKTSKISSSFLIPPVTPTKPKIASKSLESTLVQKNRSEPVLKGRTPRQLWQPSTRPSKHPGRKTLPTLEF
ncbi:hypothetical protein FRC05_005758 [Tulasnella sp. 425]|nr:hypothetical protein FRC05_005758 [Tulasnella sp. 425]